MNIILLHQNFQEIEQILLDLSPEALVKDPAPLLLGEVGGAQQADIFRALVKALFQSVHLGENAFIQPLVPRKLIERLGVNCSCLGHT